jgi:hypothetical protein
MHLKPKLILKSENKFNNSQHSTNCNCYTNVCSENANGGTENAIIMNTRITKIVTIITFSIEKINEL